MQTLACGHVARPGTGRMCPHLLGDGATDHVLLLTGRGLDGDLCRTACDKAERAVELVEACQGCVARYIDDQFGPAAWRGEPSIVERPEPFGPATRVTRLPAELGTVVEPRGPRRSRALVDAH